MNRRQILASFIAALSGNTRAQNEPGRNSSQARDYAQPPANRIPTGAKIERLGGNPDNPEYTTDVCIVGAGAAGITLARELANTGVQCLLLESGDYEFDAATQALTDAEHTGLYRSRVCRLRYFGGTTNHWGGWCAPLNEQDFAVRNWVPDSGWPVSHAEVQQYYPAAQAVCGLGPYNYSAQTLSTDAQDFNPYNTAQLTARFYQYSDPPTRFGDAYRADLEAAGNLTILLQASVVELATSNDASQVRAAKLQALDGSTGRVHAKQYVLACGAVENARLLLLSNRVEKTGLGNSNDLVGRYFMQHPHLACATLRTAAAEQLETLFAQHQRATLNLRASLSPSATAQAQRRILNCSATLDRTPDPVTGYGALRYIWRDIRSGKWPEQLGSRLQRLFGDLESMPRGNQLMTLYMRSEQAPNAASRITLGNELDALGQRKARINWQLGDLDKRSIAEGAQAIGQALAELGLGKVERAPWLLDNNADWPLELWGGCHQMGTTRMSATANTGVVDANCRVHGIDNLYVTGSSVFPTSGYANPTLTIVALSLRLAKHLRTLN